MTQVTKARVFGPVIIGCLVLVSAGGAVYNAIKANELSKTATVIKESLTIIKNQQDIQTSLLQKGGGGGDISASVAAALDKIQKDKLAEQQSELYKNWDNTSESKDGHHQYGNPQARFTLINYSDFECPFCKRFHETPKYLVDSAKNGLVNMQWRHFPLSFHEPMASKAAMMSECVAQQKGSKGFWAFTEYWFNHTAGNGQGFADSDNIPAVFGLDKSKFSACMSDPAVVQKIKSDMKAGDADGVTGTPATIIIDNQTGKSEKVVGAQPFSKFAQIIEAMANPDAQGQQPAQQDVPETQPAKPMQ